MALFQTGLVAFVMGTTGAACGVAVIIYGVPALKRWRESVKLRAREKKARDEARWQTLKPLFMSGIITNFSYDLSSGQLYGPTITLKGPEFEAVCKALQGTEAVKDPRGVIHQVQDALSTPGTRRKDMRRVARLLVEAIRRDKDVPVLYDHIVGNWGVLTTLPNERVTHISKCA